MVPGFRYIEYPALSQLSNVVRCYWTFEGPAVSQELHQKILPNGSTELVFHFGDAYQNLSGETIFAEPRRAFFGPTTSANMIRPTGTVKLAAIRFTPTGFYNLSKIPQHQITNQILDIQQVKEIARHIYFPEFCDKDFVNIKQVFDSLLVKMYQISSAVTDSRINFALAQIEEKSGILSITDLQKKVCLSERRFEHLFKEHVGVSAKKYAEIVKINSAVNLLMNGWDNSLTNLAHSLNFYDQAHFIKSFRKITGLSPGQFLSEHKGNFFF